MKKKLIILCSVLIFDVIYFYTSFLENTFERVYLKLFSLVFEVKGNFICNENFCGEITKSCTGILFLSMLLFFLTLEDKINKKTLLLSILFSFLFNTLRIFLVIYFKSSTLHKILQLLLPIFAYAFSKLL